MSRKQKTERTGRLKQIRTAYQMTRKADPRIGRILLVTGLGTLLVFVLAGVLLHQVVFLSILGVPFAVLIAMTVFGRRAERTAYAQVEGQPGAAAAVVQNIRRGWTIEPGVAVTRNYDIVHRAVGRPGIVLIGEGSPSRLSNLIAAEKRKTARVVGDTPIYDVTVGTDEGQVPLRKLQSHLMKLPRNLRPADVDEITKRLRPLSKNQMPIPKGPLPKGARIPRGPR